MTAQQPAQPQQPAAPPNLDAILLVQAATLLTLEAGSAYAATISLRRALAAFRRSANRRWMMAGQNPAAAAALGQQAREHLVQELVVDLRRMAAHTQGELGAVLRREAQYALELGAKHAGEQVNLSIAADELALDETALRLIEHTPTAATAHLLRAAEQVQRAQ